MSPTTATIPPSPERRAFGILALLLLLAGCSGTAQDTGPLPGDPFTAPVEPPEGTEPPARAEGSPPPAGRGQSPVPDAKRAARDPRPVLMQPRFLTPQVLEAAAQAVGGGPEPGVHAGRDGTLYVDALMPTEGRASAVWRSDDGGKTYARLASSTLRGPSDADLGVAPDGALYRVGLNPSVRAPGDPAVPFQASRDRGATWSDAVDVAAGADADRPWVTVLANGTVAVSWKAEGGALRFRTSEDGARWSPIREIPSDAFAAGPAVQDPATGALHIPYSNGTGRDLRVASSWDGGRTWGTHRVTDTLGTTLLLGQTTLFPIAAADTAGTLYVAWSTTQPGQLVPGQKVVAAQGVYLSHSSDGGATWSPPRLLSPPSRSAIFPWVSAGAPGRVVVTWYESANGVSDAAPDLWDVALMESVTADQPDAVFLGGHVNASPVHVGQVCGEGTLCSAGDRSRGDFFGNAIKADGQPIVAWVADGLLPGTASVVVGGVAEGTPLL